MRALFHRQDDGEWVTAMGPSNFKFMAWWTWCNDTTDDDINDINSLLTPLLQARLRDTPRHSETDSETLHAAPRQTPRQTPRHSMTRSETLRDSYMHTPWHTPWDTPCTRPGSCRYYEGFVTTYALEHVLLAHSLSSLPTLPRLKDDDRW